MHHRQDRQMVIRAVQMAVWQRQESYEVILHSDRGAQFRSGDYQRYLAANNLVCSMSAVGHCRDNAACEGFFGLLKRERIYTRPWMQHERMCSTTSSDATIQGCGEGSPGRIRRLQLFLEPSVISG